MTRVFPSRTLPSDNLGLPRLAMLGALGLALGCAPPIITKDTGNSNNTSDEVLDGRGLFEYRVKSELVASCSCHSAGVNGFSPFLATGSEYASITGYRGGLFVPSEASTSPLLTKGAHAGPALTVDQTNIVKGWLDVEATERGASGNSPTTPAVPFIVGDYYISLRALTQDPLARITFSMQLISGRTFRLTNLQLTAGPGGGIKIKHPRLVYITAGGATLEPSDALSTVDVTADAGKTVTIGSGAILLPNVPASSSLVAFIFEQINVVNPMPVNVACKSLNLFTPPVTNTLAICASQCHSAVGTRAEASRATRAFPMDAALKTDQTALASLCVDALGRINVTTPDKSILVQYVQPPTQGGIASHVFKLDDATFTSFKAAVSAWAAAEK
ncbi:MAG TPA: hypothetical protein PKO07_17190 [Pseudomonadota bacterium]|jgi:hypothetical protein|nr:hypothetical protein [Pseudomonadota bacterium]